MRMNPPFGEGEVGRRESAMEPFERAMVVLIGFPLRPLCDRLFLTIRPQFAMSATLKSTEGWVILAQNLGRKGGLM